jgi:DNA polymerase
MKGFFSIDKPIDAPPRTYCGGTCTLNKGCHSPKMPVTGQGRLKILVVAEAPGQMEDEQNTQLIGPAGQVLRDTLAEFGVDLDRDCRKTNAVRCRPPDNRKPTGKEIIACQPHIWDEIKEHPPKLILLLGQVAVESFLSGRVKSPGQIGRWRGFVIPDQKAGCWVAPAFHPSYILRSREGRAIRGKAEAGSVEELFFIQDIERALKTLRAPIPHITPAVEVLTDCRAIRARLTSLKSPVAIDYETTGLKPYGNGHRIISCGVCGADGAFAFPTAGMEAEWKKVLANPEIKKIAHNMKFESQWAAQCLGAETKGWIFDTMLASHLLDNRRGICGLKHQVYLSFGIESWGGDFDFENEPIREPTEELLKYNASDAFWTMQLYKKQRALFK